MRNQENGRLFREAGVLDIPRPGNRIIDLEIDEMLELIMDCLNWEGWTCDGIHEPLPRGSELECLDCERLYRSTANRIMDEMMVHGG